MNKIVEKSKLSFNLTKASEIRGFILENYGIDAEIKNIEGKIAVKVDNHFSLFSIISKIRKDFSFNIYHKAKTNTYIIYLQ